MRFSPRLVPCGLAVSAGDERWTSPAEPLSVRSMVPGALGLRELVLQHLRVLRHGLSFQGGVLVIVQKEDGGQRGGKFKSDKKNRYLTMQDLFLIGTGVNLLRLFPWHCTLTQYI